MYSRCWNHVKYCPLHPHPHPLLQITHTMSCARTKIIPWLAILTTYVRNRKFLILRASTYNLVNLTWSTTQHANPWKYISRPLIDCFCCVKMPANLYIILEHYVSFSPVCQQWEVKVLHGPDEIRGFSLPWCLVRRDINDHQSFDHVWVGKSCDHGCFTSHTVTWDNYMKEIVGKW